MEEPTRGLHLEDITRLLAVLKQLLEEGNTVLVVEHHLDFIKCEDWVINLGPGGGDSGGHIVPQDPPEEVANSPKSTHRTIFEIFRSATPYIRASAMHYGMHQ